MLKKGIGTLLIAGALLATAGNASAHVTVWPKEATADSYEKYIVRVPVEKDVATTKVRVEFPAGVKIGTVMPQPGWTYQFDKDAEGRFTAITWTATGDGIKPHEFTEFALSGKNPAEAGTIAWKAYQTYADGIVVEWTGDPSSKTPASVTTLKPKTDAGHDHHDDTKKEETNKDTTTEQEQAAPAPTAEPTSNTLPILLAGAALLVALISLFRKRT